MNKKFFVILFLLSCTLQTKLQSVLNIGNYSTSPVTIKSQQAGLPDIVLNYTEGKYNLIIAGYCNNNKITFTGKTASGKDFILKQDAKCYDGPNYNWQIITNDASVRAENPFYIKSID